MDHSADGFFSPSRHGVIRTVGATVMLAGAFGAGSLPHSGEAATQGSNDSDRVEPVFRPNEARLAVSFSRSSRSGACMLRAPVPTAPSR
jgi:hypothetical protein